MARCGGDEYRRCSSPVICGVLAGLPGFAQDSCSAIIPIGDFFKLFSYTFKMLVLMAHCRQIIIFTALRHLPHLHSE